MTLINATQGVVFPRKRVSLGDMYQKKRGLVIFWGTFLKCAGTTKLSVFCLTSRFRDQESSWSADQVTGVYIYRRKRVKTNFLQISTLYSVKYLKDKYHPQNKADNTKYMTISFIPLIDFSFTE